MTNKDIIKQTILEKIRDNPGISPKDLFSSAELVSFYKSIFSAYFPVDLALHELVQDKEIVHVSFSQGLGENDPWHQILLYPKNANITINR